MWYFVGIVCLYLLDICFARITTRVEGPATCGPEEFQCKITGSCLPPSFLCDGTYDCSPIDHSDEDPTFCHSSVCSPNYYRCIDSTKCIPLAQVCDGNFDCPDNDDEAHYCRNLHSCIEKNCPYGCKPTRDGPRCYCPNKFEPQGKDCVDADECLIDGTCDQQCTNTNGSFTCSCATGYLLENNTLCIPNPKLNAASLIIVTNTDLKQLDFNTLTERSIAPLNATAMDINFKNKSVCWVSNSDREIVMQCLKIDNPSISWNFSSHNFSRGGIKVEQMSLDWISGNWYFAGGKIDVCKSDLSICLTIMDGLYKTNGIAVDPTVGYLFYTNSGSRQPYLERANLDGTERKALVIYKISLPLSLALDLPRKEIYWLDMNLNSLEKVDYDGLRRRTILQGYKIKNSFGLSLFGNYLYVSNSMMNTLIQVNKFNGSDLKLVKALNNNIFTINVWHALRQPQVTHSCGTNNGNCHHLCITAYINGLPSAQCKCLTGFRLDKSKQCVVAPASQFLLYGRSQSGVIKGILMDPSSSDDVIVPITSLSRPTALDYHVATQYIYYSDATNNLIARQHLNGTGRQVVLRSGLRNCEGLAIDWMGNNLYWTDEGLLTVSVAKLSNLSINRILVQGNMSHPRAIVVDPSAGYMYWTDWADSPSSVGQAKIERAYMDGSVRMAFVDTNLQWPNGLTIDYSARKLYWCDANLDKIESINLDQTDRKIIYNGDKIKHPYGLALFDKYIYWTEFKDGHIWQYNVNSSNVSLLRTENRPLFAIRLYDEKSQKDTNACSKKNGNCEELCLAIPGGHQCSCQAEKRLNSDMYTCETNADYKPQSRCADGLFECRNHRCILPSHLCDGDNDCGDNSDEDSSSACFNTTCPPNSFRCNNNRCIPKHWLCDHADDCRNNEDESFERCSNNTCAASQFSCQKSGRCIPINWVCDHQHDCGENDFSDEEQDCDRPTCSPVEYQCHNKKCISLAYLCDGADDCRDNSDELNCNTTCRNGNCTVPSAPQCPDGAYCYPKPSVPCREYEFKCANGMCIRREFQCDLQKDCLDGSDEIDCGPLNCTDTEFDCADNSRCISQEWKCDGKNDCYDNSDEQDCLITKLCPHPHRRCNISGIVECLNISKICNKNFDCDDQSDESPICSDDQCSGDTSLCTHFCHNTPEGHVCSCPANMKLMPDGNTCVDAQTCLQWGVCSQACVQQYYSHMCKCFEGYILLKDNFTCKIASDIKPYIVYSSRHELKRIDLNGEDSGTLVAGLRNTIAIDFLFNNEASQIFWTDVVDDKIYKGTMVFNALTDIKVVIQAGLATAEGLAVDWIGQNLYWVDSNQDQIEVAKLNGSFRTTLIAGNIESPRAIALDPRVGLLFWSDWENHHPRIESCSMSGEHRRLVYNVSEIPTGGWPNGLTIDYLAYRIYWVDARSDTIHTARYDGSDLIEVLRGHEFLSHSFAISLFENHMYWTDWRTNKLVKANKWNGTNVVVIQESNTQPFDIHIFHPSRQPLAPNPCGDYNGGCSHLCLININQTFSCRCPHLMQLHVDNKTCVYDERFLLFSRPNEIRGVNLKEPYYNYLPSITVPLVENATAIDFDAKESRVYWTDLQFQHVRRAYINGTGMETIIDTGIPSPYGLAIDWISRNMFISSHGSKSRISVSTLQGEYRMVLIYENLIKPCSLAVLPSKGKLFWADCGGTSHKIEIANMDGSNRTDVANNLHQPSSLTIDTINNKLYWVDQESNHIYFKNWDEPLGNKISTYAIDITTSRLFAVCVYKTLLYLGSRGSNRIMTVDLETFQNLKILRNYTSDIMALHVYDIELQTGSHPCSINKGGCSQLCLPVSKNDFVCRCTSGYHLSENQKHCTGYAAFLMYSLIKEIHGISLDPSMLNSEVLPPISRISQASVIDYHAGDEFIYWADTKLGTISRIGRDLTRRETVIKDDLSGVEGLAVDWIAGNLYWSNSNSNVIEVSRLNGTSRYVILSKDLDKPTALAVHPVLGFLFWTSCGLNPKIERSYLDGSGRMVLVNSSVVQPHDLSLDFKKSKIYWCDSHLNVIEIMDFDGSNREKILSSQNGKLTEPTGLTLYKDLLFWIDRENGQGVIYQANFSDNLNITVVRQDFKDQLKDIKMYNPENQNGTNLCAVNNGGCFELCFYTGNNSRTCACTHGAVADDGRFCREYNAFLLYSRVVSIESIHLFNDSNPNAPLKPIKNPIYMRNVIGLSFDYSTQRIFYSDIQRGDIQMVYFNGSGNRVLVSKQGSVEGLAYEQLFNELYWTSYTNASINRISLAGLDAKPEKLIQLSAEDKPRGIVINSCEYQMYWTNWNDVKPSIHRSFLSGYNNTAIITTNIKTPNSIAIDHAAQKLYWSDARLDKIERCELDGSNRHVIFSDEGRTLFQVLLSGNPSHPFGLAVYGDYIFWTDWTLRAVLRANKYTGHDVVWLQKNLPRQPMAIIAVANDTEDCKLNPCHFMNGGCEDKCNVQANGSIFCSCNDARILLQDNKRCIAHQIDCKGMFPCSNGNQCIPLERTCNSYQDCDDGSDESSMYCYNRTCPEGYFTCNDRRCINATRKCDQYNDCEDASDELDCECSPPNHFRCNHGGQCIESFLRCDYEPDCQDISDEIDCPKRNCSEVVLDGEPVHDLVNCKYTTQCIANSWQCDRQNDCWDNSDEEGCEEFITPPPANCPANMVTCKALHCIPVNWVCDRDVDCADGSDEKDCNYTCQNDHFKCNDNNCIPFSWNCDGREDCLDGSDEANCTERNCEKDEFRCSSGRCIPAQWRCDGDPDCADKSDEFPAQGCAMNVCEENEFQCLNQRCILKNYECDHDDDCGDRSDEPETCDYKPCEENEFQCANKRCIPIKRKCNGYNDCWDNSDENTTMCSADLLINSPCNTYEFYCQNGKCINSSLVCNKHDDCGDNSDEATCHINECAWINQCDQICIDKPVGFECKCKEGFKLKVNSTRYCENINECHETLPCSHYCRDTHGGYICSCAEGYILLEGRDCKASSVDNAWLIFSNRYYIRRIDLNGNNSQLLALNLSNAVAIDFDTFEGCIYWTDVTVLNSSINRVCKSVKQVLHSAGVHNPDGLAVDWIARNLYWCDKGSDTIEVSTLDGKYRKVLIKTDLQEPRAIVVDPYHGYFYWTDWGDRPHIGKAGMDGSSRQEIIRENLGWPNALTIDYVTNHIFWADAKEDYIALADLDGNNIRVVIRSDPAKYQIPHIFALTVFEDYLYWTDWESKSVERAHKFTGEKHKNLTNVIHRPMDIHVYHPYRQRNLKTKNPCENNGGCSNLCLLKPGTSGPGHTCACPENFFLAADNKTCVSNCSSSHFLCNSTYKCIPFWWRCDTQNDCGDFSDEPADCPPSVCIPGLFQCNNSKCIHPSNICDNVTQCGDYSDEMNCELFTCLSSHFKCPGTHICTPITKRCNGIPNECPDNKDEENCPAPVCSDTDFRCANGLCIPKLWVCDNDPDCSDRSDEPSNCTERACGTNEFHCNSGRCIPMSWKCDGDSDCRPGDKDSEDEGASCQNVQCDSSYFTCNNSKCIPGRWRCDYDNDCGDNSDEDGCGTFAFPRNCSESEFRCNNGRCIQGNWVCNGEDNCEDRSDEQNCELSITCDPIQFRCLSSYHCIPSIWKCDNDTDCVDGSDEVGCAHECPQDEFRCNNTQCRPLSWRCDGDDDCGDNSDENAVMCKNVPCRPGRFRCENYICILQSRVCDGTDHCGDGSDEKNCKGAIECNSYHPFHPSGFLCDNGLCINQTLVCDTFDDCGDGSDERSCVTDPCRKFGVCSQRCIRKKYNNHTCICDTGYIRVLERNHTCKATGSPPYLLIADDNLLHKVETGDIAGSEYYNVFEGATRIESMDVYYEEPEITLVWTDQDDAAIYKLKTAIKVRRPKRNTATNSSKPIALVTGLKEPRGIAVDWMARRMYWVDAGANTVEVANLDGKMRKTIISHNLDQPHDIALDPETGLIFWTDWGRNARIESCNLDGSNRSSIINKNIQWPTGITVDHANQRIYWTDPKAATIETTNFDGTDRHVVKRFKHGEDRAYMIAVFEDNLYFSNHHNSKIFKMSKFGRSNITYLVQELNRVTDLVVVHAVKQKKELPNRCKNNICGAGVMCFPLPDNYTCMCPDGFDFLENKCVASATTVAPSRCNLTCNKGQCILDENKRPFCSCSDYCMNNATCSVNKNGDTFCKCMTGFSGPRCDQCVDLKCINGYCVVDKLTKKKNCTCYPGYNSVRCESSYCDNYCQNRGTCTLNKAGTPECSCPPGFSGNKCDIDECLGYCNNGGKCKHGQLLSCSCPSGYSGSKCEKSHCDPPCSSNGHCEEIANDGIYKCNCSSGYSGPQCEDASQEPFHTCLPNPCQNGGICLFITDSFKCKCLKDFTGTLCQVAVIDLCEKHCFFGGTCIMPSLPNKDPECKCAEGYSGPRCENKDYPKTGSQREDLAGTMAAIIIPVLVIVVILFIIIGVVCYKRRMRGKPFMHVRMQDNSNVEISNPMYMREDYDEDEEGRDPLESQFHLDPEKTTNFSNPMYDTLYNEHAGNVSEEKKGLLHDEKTKVKLYDDNNHLLDKNTYA